MKLIDADAIEKAVRKRVYAIEVDDILAEIANTPSIDIVRCKECKHYDTDVWAEKGTYWCGRISDWGNCKYVNADDFCSRGEREGE